MDNNIQILLNKINIDEASYQYFNDAIMKKIKVNSKNNSWNILIDKDNLLPVEVLEELESKKNIDKALLENISNKYGVELYLEDSSNNIVYSNIEKHNFNYSKNKLININNKSYSLMISKELDVSVSSIIKKLLFLELFIILLTTIVVTVFVNKKILKPIFYLRYDMLAYKNKHIELVRFDESRHEIFNATDDIRLKYYNWIFKFLKE